MTGPTRVKDYFGTPQQQAGSFDADRSAAAVYGWEPLRREVMPDRLRITYHQPEHNEWASRPAPPPPSVAPSADTLNITAVVMVVAGLMVAAGAFLPWITVATGFVSVSRSGMDGGDGWIALAVGALMAVVGLGGLRSLDSVPNIAAVALGLGALGLGAFEYLSVQDRITNADATVASLIQVGVGVYLILGGGALAFVASIALWPRGEPKASDGYGLRSSVRPKAPGPAEDHWKAG